VQLSGVPVASFTAALSTAAPTLLQLPAAFGNVDSVAVSAAGGNPAFSYVPTGMVRRCPFAALPAASRPQTAFIQSSSLCGRLRHQLTARYPTSVTTFSCATQTSQRVLTC